MDPVRYRGSICVSNAFIRFVTISLLFLLGTHVYLYIWVPNQHNMDSFQDEFANMKYVVMQLSKSLAETNKKHKRLQNAVQGITGSIPRKMTEVASNTLKELRNACCQKVGMQCNKQVCTAGDIIVYDRQLADYALESAGARILDTGDTVDHVSYESPVGWTIYVLTKILCRNCLGARAIIRPGTLPGECWAFKGSQGEVTIRLVGTVRITGFSIEHIPARISPTGEIMSAPRLCQVEGLATRRDQYPHDFGTYEYDKDDKPIQYFKVLLPAIRGYNMIRLRILSNWGHPEHTCVYRFRVHGDLVPEHSVVAEESSEMLIDNE